MFSWIVGTSLKFRFLLVAISAALLVFGSDRIREMPIDVFPEFAPPKVEIQTIGLGMTAAEVEEFITIPMEDVLRSTPGLDIIRSKSIAGLSDIILIFKMGEDIIEARQRVSELLSVATTGLPLTAGLPVMLQPLSSTSRVMKIGISSSEHDIKDLSMIAYWTIRFRLMNVPGVANVPIWGERIKALTVHADPVRMRAYNVTLDQVECVGLRAAEAHGGGQGPHRRHVRHAEPAVRHPSRDAPVHPGDPGRGPPHIGQEASDAGAAHP
jgi:Cu/Ag efflux pump CusA